MQKIYTKKSAETAEWIKTIAAAVVIYVLISSLLFQFMTVRQTSMSPTLAPGNRVGVLCCAYWFGAPSRGDIVIINITPSKRYIKRVVGLGGENIEIKDNVVYINGIALNEAYLGDTVVTNDYQKTQIPPNHYFVMGDNREGSIDSRFAEIGMISQSAIVGRVFFRLSPFTFYKSIEQNSYQISF